MTRAELADIVAFKVNTESGPISKKLTEQVIAATLATIKCVTDEKTEIILRGFGTFRSQDRKSTNGRNPSTGESIVIPAKRVMNFKSKVVFK